MLERLTPAQPRRATLLRTAVALATVGLLAPALTAHATATRVRKPVCHLVSDPSGDATGTGTAATAPNDANLDIVGADIATNAKTLTAVVRLRALAMSDSASPTGREYQVVYNVGTTTGFVDAVISPTGTSFAGGKGKGVVDLKKKEVRISVPLSALQVPIPRTGKLTSIGARTYRVVGSDQIALGNADKADSASTYSVGWPSCVKVGA